MYIFTNAIKNIGRNKGRNGLIGFIMLIIILATAISLIIHNASLQIIDGYKQKYGSEVILTRVNAKVPSDLSEYKEPNSEMYEKFSKSALLNGASLSSFGMGRVENAKAIGEGTVSGSGANKENNSNGVQSSYVSPTNSIYGYSEEVAKAEFSNGDRKVVEGELFKSKNEAVISKELAELNHWNVGDEINLNVADLMGQKKVAVKIKITGFYTDSDPDREDSGLKTAATNRLNNIITSYETFSSNTFDDMMYVNARYTMKNPSEIDALEKEFRSLGLAEYFDVTVDDSAYKKIVAPVENMASITQTFVIAMLVVGGAILIILSTIAIRERKYEVGVLRAMGMKKSKVSFGLLSEMLVITSICLLLGLGSSVIASKPISNALFASQVASTPGDENTPAVKNGEEITSMYASHMPTTVNSADAITEMNAELSSDAVLQIILLSLLLAGISSIAGIVFVTRYEPAKILSERN